MRFLEENGYKKIEVDEEAAGWFIVGLGFLIWPAIGSLVFDGDWHWYYITFFGAVICNVVWAIWTGSQRHNMKYIYGKVRENKEEKDRWS